jgi:hypothetical protein
MAARRIPAGSATHSEVCEPRSQFLPLAHLLEAVLKVVVVAGKRLADFLRVD